MTAGETKENLLKLHGCAEGFALEFTGRKSARRNGWYVISERKIAINDRNFDGGGAGGLLFYTAMHELAHHIQVTEHGEESPRCHTKLFYSLLDGLADKAEGLGLYRREEAPEVEELAREAAALSAEIASLQRKLGETLDRLHTACIRNGARYEDVLKRKAKLSERAGKKLMKAAALGLPEGTGFEIQEAVAGAKSAAQREAMAAAAAEGGSAAQVKRAGAAEKEKPGGAEALAGERRRLEKKIASLQRRLDAVLARMAELEEGG